MASDENTGTTHETEPAAVARAETPAAHDPDTAAAPEAASTPRRRATRTTKTTAASKRAPRKATAAAEELPSTTEQGAEPEVGSGAVETPAPAKRARKAAAKPAKAAAKAPAKASAASADQPDGKTAAKKANKRAAKKVTAPTAEEATEVPAVDPEQAAPVSDEALLVGTVEGVGAGDAVLAEGALEEPTAADGAVEPVDADADAEAEDDAAATTPTVPAVGFGLVFQAPDTTVRRSRRATAPVSAPVVAPEPFLSDASLDASFDADSPDDVLGEADGDEESVGAGSDATDAGAAGRRRRRGGRGRRTRAGAPEGVDGGTEVDDQAGAEDDDSIESGSDADDEGSTTGSGSESATSRRRRRRRRGTSGSTGSAASDTEDPPGTVTRVREPRQVRDEPTAVRGSTRLEAKKQRRREGREAGRRRTIITEAEFLARREAVDRVMVVRGKEDRTQIAVLEDGVLVEHYVSRETATTMVGNVYLGRVQNVLPSMEAAFVDIGKGRNAVLYAGEVNWDAAGLEVNQAKRIENALSSGDTVLVQVTKDPIGHKGARLTSQISLPGRFLVYVPEGSMTGISRKLPDTERARLKAILKEIVPDSAGVIVRTAAEGASEEELRADVERLTKAWEKIQAKAESVGARKAGSGGAPSLVHGEPDLTVRVIRDIFTEDFSQLVVSGDVAWEQVSDYVEGVAPDLAARLSRWTSETDVFTHHRIQEQLSKAMDRKVWLPSGGSLVIDRTEAMTVVDVNTGKFVGSGGNLEETVTKNNIEAAEEIVRQLRLRDIGGIIVIDFIDMVLESNRDLVVRRLLECLGRDRTKHQVAEVTSLGLVQMTRKRVGSGLIEVFSESCEHCSGRGIIVHSEPIDRSSGGPSPQAAPGAGTGSRGRGRRPAAEAPEPERRPSGPTAAQIAAAAHAAALKRIDEAADEAAAASAEQDAPVEVVREIDGDDSTPGTAIERRAGSDLVPMPVTSEPALVEGQVSAASDHAQVESVVSVEPEQQSAPQHQGEPVGQPTPTPTTTAQPEPVARPRRRRGRVVAPAGPPRANPAEGNESGQNLEHPASGE